MHRIILLSLLTVLVINCKRKSHDSLSNEVSVSLDSLQHYSQDVNLLSVQMNLDTLYIVSTDQSIYYPFGEFSKIDSFHSIIKGFNSSIELKHPYGDSLMQKVTIYKLMSNRSCLRFFSDPEVNKLNIVSGEIVDDDILLDNGIHVGQSLSEVLLKLFTKLPVDYNNVKVIKVESGLTGIWHYYEFKAAQLTKIRFETDYQF